MDITNTILVVGGGLNGPTLALALADAGMDVTLIDAGSPPPKRIPSFTGRSYAISLGSQRLLTALGVWNHVADDAAAMLDIKVTDGRVGEGPSPFFMHFNHAEIEEGPMGHMVEDRHLRRALFTEMAKRERITVRTSAEVVAQDVLPDSAQVTLKDGTVLGGALIIGCDGRHSGVARRAGIARTEWAYDQLAVTCAIKHERPHEGIAHQFFTPGGPLAILPLTGDRSGIVWSERKDRARDLVAMDDAAFLASLRPAFGSFLGEIALAGQRGAYPLSLSVTQSMTAARVALVGDAAHGIHPIAGQGLNAGLRDVAALFDVLNEASMRGEDIGAAPVLTRYQAWRGAETGRLVAATDIFNRLFSNDNPLVRLGRDLGMGVVNAVPSLRRKFIREAAGLNGRLPTLMRP